MRLVKALAINRSLLGCSCLPGTPALKDSSFDMTMMFTLPLTNGSKVSHVLFSWLSYMYWSHGLLLNEYSRSIS